MSVAQASAKPRGWERLRPLANRLPARHDLVRTLMHVPVGLICGLASVHWPVAASFIFLAFLTYEVLEDWRIGDHSYIDINGLVFGCVGAVVFLEVNQRWLGWL